MNNNARSSEKPRPDRVQGFFAYMQHAFRDPIEKLTPADRKKIRRIAAGEIADVRRGDRVKAFRAVADFGRGQDGKILGDVVADEAEERTVRAAAAANLGLLRAEIAEKELIGLLTIKDDLVRSKVVKSLGMIGGVQAYRALGKLRNIQSAYVKKQLAFAKALVAYRHDLEADPIPFIEGVQRRRGSTDEMLQLTVKPVRTRKVGEAMKRLEGSRYGIELAEATGFEVAAGKAQWMLFLNEQPAEEGIVKSITERKMIMGLLARWMKEGETYDTQYVVLTRPTAEDGVQIMVVRSDGEVFYSGKAAVKKGILTFLISDIKRSGTAPTKVRGKLTARGLELDLSIPIAVRKDKRKTRPMKREAFRSKRMNALQ